MSNQIEQVAEKLITNISQEIIGKKAQIRQALACLVAGGHLLLEDVPGLGKTTLAKAMARSFNMSFQRIQCTPDLMPSDVTGVSIYHQKSEAFEFMEGPVFAHVLLADEINRTSPRTQSALLEAMAEGTVTVDRVTHTLPHPFFVIATQNPIEFTGTYPLPEAQMDRFMMRLSLGYPDQQSEMQMLASHQTSDKKPQASTLLTVEQLLALRKHAEKIPVLPAMQQYITQLVNATRTHDDIHMGASPRASLALMKVAQAMALLTGKSHLTPALVQSLLRPVLAHRLVFANRQMDEAGKRQFFTALIDQVPVPDFPSA